MIKGYDVLFYFNNNIQLRVYNFMILNSCKFDFKYNFDNYDSMQ